MALVLIWTICCNFDSALKNHTPFFKLGSFNLTKKHFFANTAKRDINLDNFRLHLLGSIAPTLTFFLPIKSSLSATFIPSFSILHFTLFCKLRDDQLKILRCIIGKILNCQKRDASTIDLIFHHQPCRHVGFQIKQN